MNAGDLPPPAEATEALHAGRQAAAAWATVENPVARLEAIADAVLAAAAPLIREAAYAEIRQLATDTGAIVTCQTPETDDGVNIRLTHTHPFADLIGDPPC